MKQTTKRPKRILALLVLAVVCGSVGPIVFFWCLPSSSSVATGGASSLLSEYYAAEFEMVMSVMSSSSKSVPRVSSHPRYGSSNRNVTTIDTTRKNHDNNKKKNLAVLGAAGRQSTIPVILHNVYTHFYDNSWDILIFCYTLEAFDFISTNLTSATTTTSTSIPKPRRFSSSTNSTSMTTILVPTTSSSSIITATSSTNHDEVSQYYRNITVFFGKGYQYGDFIQGHLFPSDLYMKQTYQYVSLILDDARIGNNYSVDGMLEFMVKHELDVATSVIEGVSEKWGRSDNEVYPGRRKKLLHNLLNNNALSASERTNPDLLASAINGTGRLVQTWEIFVTFFTAVSNVPYLMHIIRYLLLFTLSANASRRPLTTNIILLVLRTIGRLSLHVGICLAREPSFSRHGSVLFPVLL
jgi:hypothetical protein